MPVLIRIAFRNLVEHKAKSLIIGILLALGVIILVIGNSFMDTAAKGVKDTFIANYTGDIFVAAQSKDTISLFGSMAMTSGGDEVKVLPYYDKVMEHVKSLPGVTGAAGQVTGYGIATLKGYEDVDKSDGDIAMLVLFGVEPSSYNPLFTATKPIMGSLLQPGQQGIVVSKKTYDKIGKKAGVTPKIGDQIVITGMGRGGFKIRSVPLVGVIGSDDDDEGKSYISYSDVDTVRLLSGLTLGNDDDTPVTAEQKTLLTDTSEDDLFGGETVVTEAKNKAPTLPSLKPAAETRKPAQVDEGAWYFIVARLKNPAAATATVASLNLWFAKEGIEAKAGDWKAASSPFGSSVDVIRIVFNIAIIIVAVVAVIIMMNTLVISVIERTGEIGTMRALGARKGFVRKMFLVETLTIALVFGVIGTAVALGSIGVLNALHLHATNSFLKLLFAGPILHTAASISSVVWSLVLVSLVAVVAHLYPVSLALKIEPVRAMQAE